MENEGRIVRIGLIKAMPKKWDLTYNWTLFAELFDRAVERGAQLVCTPECFLDGYVSTDEAGWPEPGFRDVAQTLDAGYVAKARERAAKAGVHLVFGFTERAEAGCYNAAALIGPSGEVIGCYHKTHLLDHDTRYLPGDNLGVYDTALGRIGMMICADRRWPETARTLRVRGAELIMNPTYGMCHLENEWWMRTRSYENETWICFDHPQVAFMTDPRGGIPAKLESNIPDVLVHDVDLGQTREVMFSHRRPELYDLGMPQ